MSEDISAAVFKKMALHGGGLLFLLSKRLKGKGVNVKNE